MDICIVHHPKDAIPFDDNYELLLKPEQADEGTGEGGKLQLAKHCYICFRRRKHNKTPSYITEVKLVRKGQEPLPEGFELIEKTVGGASADLGKGGSQQVYLAVRRALVNEAAFRFSTPPMLADLCLCSDKKGCAAPMDYTVLPRVLNKLGLPAEDIYLAYRHGPSAGLCDIPYEAHSLEWFPHEETYEDFPLPQNELPMFCFPRGVVLKHQKRDDTPMPSYFSFVFTSIDGDRVHVACLQFYELLPDRVLRALEAKQRILTVVGSFSPHSGQAGGASGGPGVGGEWDHDEESVTSSVDEEEEEAVVAGGAGGVDATGAPKAHHKHHHRRASASQAGQAPCSPSGAEGGACASSPRGNTTTLVPTSSASSSTLRTTTSSDRSAYGLFAPKCICIISHWPFYRALRSFLQQIYRISLSPSSVPLERYIAYFTHYMPLPPPGQHALNLHLDLGLNDRVENSSLTPIKLQLPDARSLPLMDLDYEAPFRCLSLDNVLKIFVLLLMEERLLFISSSTSLLTEVTETILTLLFPFEWMSCYIPRLPNKLTEILDAPGSFLIGIYTEGTTDSWVLPQLSDPLFVVDLDRNCIVDAEGKLDYVAAMENLPLLETLREKLRGELERTAVTVKTAEALRERDSAFELPAVPGSELEDGPANKPKLNPDVIRDAFLVFMCELLGNYTRFFNSQEGKGGSADGGAGGDMTHNGVFGAFDVPGFVASVDKTAKPLLDKMVLTQMFAALVQQRTDHSHGVDRLVFFETCVQELKERKDAEAAAAAAAAGGGGGGGGASSAGGGSSAAGRRRLEDRSVIAKGAPLRAPDPAAGPPLLIHQAVASMVRREQLLLQQQQQQAQQQQHEALVVPASSSSSSTPVNSPGAPPSPKHYQSSTGFFVDTLPSTIIVPGPSAEGCVGVSTANAGPDAPAASSGQLSVVTLPPQPLSFSYTQFPILLNKEWMAMPPSSLPPILLEIMSRRKKFLKKGNRMILARSVSECMKDWQAVGTQIGGARNKEIYLAMQIFGIYFMCLPSRVSYKGRPLKIIMQAMGILQFILDFQLERYMDEAMWRSLLVACGRCGHASTRKIAIAIFGIMRRSGLTINALTYGQYTKALAEKDATEFTATTAVTGAGTEGDAVAVVGGSASEASSSAAKGRVEIDDSPWLEERGRAWYMATCEPSAPETLKSWTVADGFKNLLARTTKAAADTKKRGDRPALQDGIAWTGELRDPKLSAHNTTVSSITLDSAGVIGMWVVCLCVNCEYMPLDEEIMTLRQDLLLVQAVDDHANHLLLCPKCETPLMPRLYYDIKTFQDGVAACGARGSCTSKQNHPHQHEPATPVLPPSSPASLVSPVAEKLPQSQAAVAIPALKTGEGASAVVAEVARTLEAVVLTVSEAAASARPASVSFSSSAPAMDASLSASVAGKTTAVHLRGEVSGLGLGTTGGDHVDYMSPFTLRMRLEKLLLEHGEECLTRDWAREHQPELYWNLVWFTTRLSIPFPFLLDSLDPVLADAAVANFPTPKSERKKKKAQAAAEAAAKANPTATLRSLRSRGMSRQDSMERLGQLFFHEVVVVGWEGEVVRNRCEKVEAMLKQRSFTPRAPPTKSSSSVGGAISTATGAGVLPSFPSFASSASSTMTLGGTLRQQFVGGGAVPSTTAEPLDAIGPLTVEQMFPNISAQELEAINEVRKTLLAKGCPGLKEAISLFFTLKNKQGGWTSEATLGSPYRVFLKLAANFHVKKLHNVAPITNLMANPGLEHEYTTAVMKLGDRFMREKVGKDERQLLAELPKRDAIKFRSVFGHLY